MVSLILNAAQERCLYIEIGSATCLCSYILGENTKTRKTILDTSNFSCKIFGRKLFEKLKSHDPKFFNYFRMSVSTFVFLVMRLSDRIRGQDTAMRACVPPKEMLAVTIR